MVACTLVFRRPSQQVWNTVRAGHKREQTHLIRTEHKAKHTQENHKDVFKDLVLVSKAIFEWKM